MHPKAIMVGIATFVVITVIAIVFNQMNYGNCYSSYCLSNIPAKLYIITGLIAFAVAWTVNADFKPVVAPTSVAVEPAGLTFREELALAAVNESPEEAYETYQHIIARYGYVPLVEGHSVSVEMQQHSYKRAFLTCEPA